MGCLCVTQQSFAQGCSPLPYILPPNRPAWPSCLHGNASVCVCVCVHVTVCVCVCVCSQVQALPTLLSSGEAEITPSSLPCRCFIWSVSLRFASCHSSLSAALTFIVSVFICPSPSTLPIFSVSLTFRIPHLLHTEKKKKLYGEFFRWPPGRVNKHQPGGKRQRFDGYVICTKLQAVCKT